jgi:hypothetical protein
MMLNRDQPHRCYRLVEVLRDTELRRNRSEWDLVDGWLELAEQQSPGSPKAILEGDYIVTLPEGTIFMEVSFKSDHRAVADSLPQWAATAGRRWAIIEDRFLIVSDGSRFLESDVRVTRH